jgi:hypothetical protein
LAGLNNFLTIVEGAPNHQLLINKPGSLWFPQFRIGFLVKGIAIWLAVSLLPLQAEKVHGTLVLQVQVRSEIQTTVTLWSKGMNRADQEWFMSAKETAIALWKFLRGTGFNHLCQPNSAFVKLSQQW